MDKHLICLINYQLSSQMRDARILSINSSDFLSLDEQYFRDESFVKSGLSV